MRYVGSWSILISTALLAGSAGCGGDNPLGRKAIHGSVTLDGTPVANGSIDFQPLQSGGVASGAVITAGKYSIAAEQGLPPGKYRVTIHATDPDAGVLPAGAMPGDDVPPAKEYVPAAWNDSAKTIDVTDSSSQEFSFDIPTRQ